MYEAIKRGAGTWTLCNLTEDMRHQVTYWKNRRNDCAHAKLNGIQASHVESFWSFIQFNLPKFVVSGGKAVLLEKVRIHFDVTLTAPNTDFNYITQEVIHSIYEHDYKVFVEELNQILGDTFLDISYESERKINFWLKLFGLSERFDKTLVTYLLENQKLCRAILKIDSSKVLYFSEHPQFIRNLWFNGLLDPSILANDLIPDEQQEEALESMIQSSQTIFPESIREDDMNTLISKGF